MELLRRLRRHAPNIPLYVSTTTVAGRSTANEKLQGLANGVFYGPLDYRFAVRNVLRAIRPSLVVVLETEIWPNCYREVKRAGCALMIVNGRISDRALPRYRRFQWFFRHVLALPDAILVQSESDRARYLELGAPPAHVHTAGNLKYDFTPPAARIPEAVEKLLARVQPAQIWIAASTMPPANFGDVDEDNIVLNTFSTLSSRHPRLLLILVPRKPERFDEVAIKIAKAGARFLRRSSLRGTEALELPAVLLLDSIGELSGLFSAADVVFMGGTLARQGGHNVVEPAYFGKPVIAGPHMENFAAIAQEFADADALFTIDNGEELAGAVAKLLDRPKMTAELGARARKLAESKRGVADRLALEIVARCERSVSAPIAPLVTRALLGPLARAWEMGAALDRRSAWSRRRGLKTPVIGIGGITIGGAGKTPLVDFLARRFQALCLQPAILTRGYHRRAPGAGVVVPAGAPVSIDLTGDEAQIYVRSGAAHVGIGAERFTIGRAIEERFHPDVFLLDDGFQHHRLDRTLDIVSIDALNPFGGRQLFPLGQLREPLTALDRADAFVIARAEPGLPLVGIENVLRQYNPRAPIFRSRIVVERWTDLEWGATCEPAHLPYRKVAAFCGLANPSAFWSSLALLGVQVTFAWRFPDHHHYGPLELKRLAARAQSSGAEALVTTEKDLMNLNENAIALIAPMRLYWLKIGIQIEGEEEFLRYLRARIRR